MKEYKIHLYTRNSVFTWKGKAITEHGALHKAKEKATEEGLKLDSIINYNIKLVLEEL